MLFVFDFMQGLAEDLRTAHFLSMVTGVLNSFMYSVCSKRTTHYCKGRA